MIYCLAGIGIVTIIFAGAIAAGMFVEFVKSTVQHRKRCYEYKHRFDKPPVAKCYCIDCEYWDKETHYCAALHGFRTADDWFCWRASPYKEEVLNNGRNSAD